MFDGINERRMIMPTLFDKMELEHLTIKNRLVMTPMGVSSSDADGAISDRQLDFYEARARGGFGLIYPSCNVVTTEFETAPLPNVLNSFIQGTKVGFLADRVHHYGAKLCIQLSCGIGRVSVIDPFTPPHAPSAIPSFWFPNLTCIPFTTEEIHRLVKNFGYSAFLAKSVGADAVEIHAYGGYVIDQFMSPLWNKRTDEYGGSFENRMRIVHELRDAVRENCGPDFPVFIKITPEHGFEGGRTLEEGIEIAKEIDKMGFDLIHLEKGCYEAWYYSVPTIYEEEGYQVYLAKALKDAGIKTPILAQGKLQRPAFAKQVIASGAVDMVGIGHQCFADPEWANKVYDGREDDITPCIGCNECINGNVHNKNFRCAVNPQAMDERLQQLYPAREKLDVLVVGGGPGGMMCALTAAERGFDVELWEKQDHLGGALYMAGVPDFKKEVKQYVEAMSRKIDKSDVKLKLNTEASVEAVLKRNPDAVIVAGGAKPIIPKIPGIESKDVVQATEVLRDRGLTGENVIVLGGGLVGCETALYLADLGKKVTLVELLDQLLLTVDHALNNHMSLMARIESSGIKVMCSTKALSVSDGKLAVETADGTEDLAFDKLVLAVGYKADTSFSEQLKGKIKKVITIGDNVKAAKVIDTVHAGYNTARLLEDIRTY